MPFSQSKRWKRWNWCWDQFPYQLITVKAKWELYGASMWLSLFWFWNSPCFLWPHIAAGMPRLAGQTTHSHSLPRCPALLAEGHSVDALFHGLCVHLSLWPLPFLQMTTFWRLPPQSTFYCVCLWSLSVWLNLLLQWLWACWSRIHANNSILT